MLQLMYSWVCPGPASQPALYGVRLKSMIIEFSLLAVCVRRDPNSCQTCTETDRYVRVCVFVLCSCAWDYMASWGFW